MPYVQIDEVHEKTYEKEIQGRQAAYTVHEWDCSGWIDGEYADHITVKTLSGKMAAQVAAGFEYEAELDEFKGRTSYKIPTPRQEDVPQRSAPTKPTPQRQASKPAPAPRAPITFEQMAAMQGACIAVVKAAGYYEDEVAINAAASTLFIQCMMGKVEIPESGAATEAKKDKPKAKKKAPPKKKETPPEDMADAAQEEEHDEEADDNLPF